MGLELIGWIGAICFAICGLPQCLKSVSDGHSDGIAWGFLILWFTGEVFTLIYVLPKMDWPLIFNYACNLIFVGIIIRYKFRPRLTIFPKIKN
jgi:uncharacterized protein with PQ loop repeat